jgi:hypothetical protein
MITAGKQATTAPPKIEYLPAKTWNKGVYTRIDSDRVPLEGLVVAENVQLNQDGVVEPRPGLSTYGIQPTGIVRGQIFEYVRMNTLVTPNTAETWLIWMEDRSGVGTVVTAKDGGTQTVVSGKTYTSTAKAHFEQIYGKVLIQNGIDNLSYMDVQTQTITPMVALTQPSTAPTLTPNTISGSVITYRYRYTAANQGETAGSTAGTQGANKLREQWNGTTESMTITGNRITGAQRYNLYVGTEAGFEYYLDTITDPGTGTTWTYTDSGAIAENTQRIAPVGDSTAGPKTTRATNIKGQVFMVGDTDNTGRIWFGGNGASALDFSSFNGGGWVEPNKGGKDFPVIVKPFRDGKGTPTAVCFSKGTNGAGKRYLLQPATTTLGATTISYMSVQEDNGQDGTDSPDGVVMINDGAYYPSRTGFKASNTKANIQNIISTQGITDNIADKVMALSSNYMDACVGLPNDQRIFWALPYSSTTNNEIWHVDLRQGGAWMRPWYVAADWLNLYAENASGTTKMLALVGNKICQFDASNTTNDNGVPFTTNIGTGAYKFSEDGTIWGSVLDVTFVFLRLQGNVNVSVTASTEDGIQTFTDNLNATSTQAVSGLGRYGLGMIGLGNLSPVSDGIPVTAAKARTAITVPIDEECNYLTMGINSVDAGVSYQLSEIIVRYVEIGWKDLDT